MKYFLTIALLLFIGCSPFSSNESVSVSPWESYEQMRGVFDKVNPYQTTREDLKSLNIDPVQIPNVAYLNGVAVRNMFLNNTTTRLEDLPKGIQECLKDFEDCYGFQYKYQNIRTKGEGNIFLRWLKFKKETRTQGPDVIFQVFFRENLVVYKQWGGTPTTNQYILEKNPFGPLQEPWDVMLGTGAWRYLPGVP